MCTVYECFRPAASGGRYPDGLCEMHADEWCKNNPPMPDIEEMRRDAEELIAAGWHVRPDLLGGHVLALISAYEASQEELKRLRDVEKKFDAAATIMGHVASMAGKDWLEGKLLLAAFLNPIDGPKDSFDACHKITGGIDALYESAAAALKEKSNES